MPYSTSSGNEEFSDDSSVISIQAQADSQAQIIDLPTT